VNELLKESLVERFREHLDTLGDDAGFDTDAGTDTDADTGTDLRSLYIEMAALRSEVRTESRLVKDTLDLVRSVVERGEADRARLTVLEREAAQLRPLLIDLIDVRDRLAAGAAGPSTEAVPAPAPWYRRLLRRADKDAGSTADAWREGLRMTLNRFDRVLRERSVVLIDVVGKPFDPRIARAVGTAADSGQDNGIVVREVRSGFLWEGEMLRPADVVVNKTTREEGARS
jgi:molecular chaperone GrpE